MNNELEKQLDEVFSKVTNELKTKVNRIISRHISKLNKENARKLKQSTSNYTKNFFQEKKHVNDVNNVHSKSTPKNTRIKMNSSSRNNQKEISLSDSYSRSYSDSEDYSE